MDGRRFAPVGDVTGGEIGVGTLFDYRQDRDLVEATYAGGRIRRGHLVGTVAGDTLDFRYVQLHTDGTTASGHCVSVVEELPDGRLRLSETWQWESRAGAGTSVVEELPRGDC
ncbi:hypothetical protein CC117_08640 [Parafrankia colletiae]|uniref:N-acetylglutamate synthase n=1 Tax=Parafrankia colletiae TaxID=573497 RepID=A0A1S1Q6K1_9ACTN|nr:hypothetical protein CC117_08640 [Parafrankia colletiae]